MKCVKLNSMDCLAPQIIYCRFCVGCPVIKEYLMQDYEVLRDGNKT